MSSQKTLRPARKRLIILDLRGRLKISTKRACTILEMNRSSYYYDGCPKDDRAERMKIKQIAADHPRYGYRRIKFFKKRGGWLINHMGIK